MSRILYLIFTSCLMAFSLSGFASPVKRVLLPRTPAPINPNLEPYKVTGVACLPGEKCKLIKKGEYKGYYLKSNIPFDDPRFKKIRGNMFTKAVLNREKAKRDGQIDTLRKLAQSCTGDVCTSKYDSKGCNTCGLNVSRKMRNRRRRAKCFKRPNGKIHCPPVRVSPNSPMNINYLCTKKGCTGSKEYMVKLRARADKCIKYGPNPLPPLPIDKPRPICANIKVPDHYDSPPIHYVPYGGSQQ